MKEDECYSSCPYKDFFGRELDGIHMVISELSKSTEELTRMVYGNCSDIALLKFKASLYGAVAGLIPGLIAALIAYFNK